ncbi:MAG: 16S rRNA (cytosine(967)-C(5))-methyltransferase RsmB [Gammaproteobacteria bacterium]|nr:16S rRNA (cytosine(967)-C(5))-methyltransferase RsmB [Gammaproteobacteria bacterium]MCW5582529.1 16S rRNA (cytosine(967)-C(5))-methyltransferase RsmB [Gammaproteobacteria bacterium]
MSRIPTGPNLRLIAARIIHDVTNGCSLSDRLNAVLLSIQDPRDRGFVQAVCYGVCRFYTKLDVILSHLLKKPMKAKDSDVHALLLVGLFQLMAMRIPEYAAVTETVNATEKLKKPWARGLVNAVMREYLRNRQSLEEPIQHDIEAHYAHPQWWVDVIRRAWPKYWTEVLDANNQHPPFALRVNQQHLTRDEYIKKLQQAGYTAQIIPETTNGIILDSAVSIDELPGFSTGDVSVQDGAAQLAAELLNLMPNQHVLDACAAPGGKLTHLLEVEPDLSLIAVEKEESRMASIKENLMRLNMRAECVCHDVNNIEDWWDGKLFDRILLDAPCSASGVVRRHPDIKLLRHPEDIALLAKEQYQLLTSLWPLLHVGGLLLYATCSILPEENTHVLQRFLALQPDAKEVQIAASWGLPCEIGRQILPGIHQLDGFYYALLEKVKI